jgi:hypothetical protein
MTIRYERPQAADVFELGSSRPIHREIMRPGYLAIDVSILIYDAEGLVRLDHGGVMQMIQRGLQRELDLISGINSEENNGREQQSIHRNDEGDGSGETTPGPRRINIPSDGGA